MSTPTTSIDRVASTAPPTQGSNLVRGRVAWFFSMNNRFLAPMLITLILVVGQLTFGFLESYTQTGLAILSSIVMELILGKLITGKWPHLASAYITGISVGILIRSTELWPYALCALISITSKYAIRW